MQDIDSWRGKGGFSDCANSDDFTFILLETDWDDYNGDGVIDESRGRDLEESYTTNMFNSPLAEIIELTPAGNSEYEWPGDPGGETLQLVRSFDLQVYHFDDEGEPSGFKAVGEAIFLCKPNEDGEYQIWQWTDLSEV